MYKLSIPIMSSTVTRENRETYAELCREAGAERIFLANGSILEPIPDSLAENVSYFQSQGFEVGVWTDTIGHGFALSHADQNEVIRFSPIVDVMGNRRAHTNCPTDPVFQEYISDFVARLAQTGADLVMLDDDFRMSQHGGATATYYTDDTVVSLLYSSAEGDKTMRVVKCRIWLWYHKKLQKPLKEWKLVKYPNLSLC